MISTKPRWLTAAAAATVALLASAGCSSASAVSIGEPTTASGSATTSSDAGTATAGSATPSASATRPATITKVTTTPAQAAASLTKAGITVKGTPDGALAWRDENDLNILLVSVEQTRSKDATGTAFSTTTTRAYLAAGLEQADGGRLRDQIVESHEPCYNDGGAQPVPSSFTLTDRDGDGHTEATAGWTWSCRGDPGPVQVKLTMFTRGKHYQLTGEGQDRSNPLPSPFNQGIPAATATAAPTRAQWPAGLYDPAVALFHTLYL